MLRELVSALGMVSLTATSLIAQDSVRWRWSIGGGPNYPTGHVRFYQPGSDGSRYVFDQPLITGASRHFGHVTVGASRRHPTTAITSRIDLLYNRGESPARNPAYYPPSPMWGFFAAARPALVDEMLAATYGLQWDALPTRRTSPYVLTYAGWAYSRLQWSSDPFSEQPDQATASHGHAVGVGGGIRHRVGNRELFLELRHPWVSSNVYSMGAAPLTFGIRF